MNIIAPINASMRYEVVSNTVIIDPMVGTGTYDVSVLAPSGMKVVGGGYAYSSLTSFIVSASRPDEDGSAWSVVVQRPDPAPAEITVWAVCLSAS